jgi:hypothetical protein
MENSTLRQAQSSPTAYPTRIVADLGFRPSKKTRPTRWFRCDDGNDYTLAGLAKVLAKIMENPPSQEVINTRIWKEGCESPKILLPLCKKGYRFDGGVNLKGRGQESFSITKKVRTARSTDPEWKGMGVKPRTGNLLKLRPLGSFEMGMER